MPSISKPTWVTQLNRLGSRLPLCPNGARLTMNVVVPACGPCRLAIPIRSVGEVADPDHRDRLGDRQAEEEQASQP